MRFPPFKTAALTLGLALLSGCGDEASTATPSENAQKATSKLVRDDVVGASLTVPAEWSVHHDEYLAEAYGFVLTESDEENPAHRGQPRLRVALVQGATPEQVESLVQARRDEYPGQTLTRSTLSVGGLSGVALSGIPGPEGTLFHIVYVPVEDRVYQLNVWGELQSRAQLLDGLAFHAPAHAAQALNLPSHDEYVTSRGYAAQGLYGSRAELLPRGAPAPTEAEAEEREVSALATPVSGCAAQPAGLRWQTQWYSDTNWYSWLSGRKGWVRMGYDPGYGGYFGEGPYHLGCGSSYHQYYAVDYPMNTGAQLYSAIPGKVTWAGADTNGSYWSYGIFVVVRRTIDTNTFTSVSAHLNARNVSTGQLISATDLPYILIGWAGGTGAADPAYPHLHAAIFKNAALDTAGRPYGGTSVMPQKMRCYGCANYDVAATDGLGGGYYTSFPRQRWLKW